ncbi:MAG: hypothetical protein IPJ68_00695 [Candidatus Moraniibacteriota bacterium]|nr:MAG: hypothetical protein IPJ68_00695 [Candidatus Moranbacteria bacterium]
MATIINNPPAQSPAPSDGGSGLAGVLIGVVILVVVGFLFFAYGLPAMRGSQETKSSPSSPTINVPDTIDVNIKK